MNDDYEILADFLKIFNAYKSEKTGWPNHKIIRTKKGGTRRWRTSYEKNQVWSHKNFIATDLMRLNLRRWEHQGDIPYEEYYQDFFKSDFGFTHAVRKEFAIKVLTLGCVFSPTQEK